MNFLNILSSTTLPPNNSRGEWMFLGPQTFLISLCKSADFFSLCISSQSVDYQGGWISPSNVRGLTEERRKSVDYQRGWISPSNVRELVVGKVAIIAWDMPAVVILWLTNFSNQPPWFNYTCLCNKEETVRRPHPKHLTTNYT